jgi:hypothetical protein
MIGSWIKKKCTKALITALTSQMNGGKAMMPGLSDDVFDEFFVTCLPRRSLAKAGHLSLFLLNAGAARIKCQSG